ncbi:penicillin-binding protein [Flavobacterium lutivivi]|nr:penicillin-binding protein [Flavobacterium lutivivi]
MKVLFATAITYILVLFSLPSLELKNLNNSIDTTLINVPFPLKMPMVTEEYISEKKAKIDSFYQKNIGTWGFSGSFLVCKNGKIISEKYQGFTNLKTQKPITSTTPLHLASVSKVLTATAILKLVENDNISLDQKVTDWLPKFPYKNTTIRTLLNHRSGLQHYSRFPELLGKSWNRKKILSNQDILDLIVQHKFRLLSTDNTKFDYCNTNYVILSLIIEKATGLTYEKAMKELIFKPLKMNSSFVFNYFRDKDTVSLSYRNRTQINPWDQFDNLNGDKNIYSTTRDLAKFDLATYSPDFIKPSTLNEVYKGYSPNPKLKKNYGLGMRMKELANGKELWYHNGWWHGNTSSFIPMKKDTVTIICLSNIYTNRTYETIKLAEIY